MARVDSIRCITLVGTLLLDALAAVFGTAIVELPFERIAAQVHPLRESLFVMDLMTSAFSAALGYLAFRLTRSPTSRWVWALGACWFFQRAVFPPDGNHVVLWEMYATNSAFPDLQGLGNWSIYTLPCLRTIFYSIGAACS